MWVSKFGGEATGNQVGEIPGAIADNSWHWAQINLGALKEKIGSQIFMWEFVEVSGRWPANSALEIDEFTIARALGGTVKLSWKAVDVSGVKNYRFGWDQNPDGAPTEIVTDIRREITPTGGGTWWAHLRAQDSAGNWGAVSHLPIMLP
jgi:hypothetical protein